MISPANVRRHPLHPILVSVPIGLWIGSLLADGMYHLGTHEAFWKDVSFAAMLAGLITAGIAAVPGLVDFTALRDRRVTRLARWHAGLNVVVVCLYVVNLVVRSAATSVPSTGPVWLSVVTLALLSVAGWLGGSMVHIHGVSVSDDPRERVTIPVDEVVGAPMPVSRLGESR